MRKIVIYYVYFCKFFLNAWYNGYHKRLDGAGGIRMSERLLEQILGEMQELTKRVGNIESDQQTMKEEQQQIKQAVLETNQVVKRMEVVQEQQHRIIELLSTRSIEQAAALKRIG
jgi:hypothetical protein